jgi:proteasome lid subunit RPN8/RPN11
MLLLYHVSKDLGQGVVMSSNVSVMIDERLLQAILEGARRLYPRELVLLLRGQKKSGKLKVSEVVVPPLATHGRNFASIRLHMLPIDFSIVGTVHSHPSGVLTPSAADLNHFFGVILMIVGSPFVDEQNVAVYNRDGTRGALQIVKA